MGDKMENLLEILSEQIAAYEINHDEPEKLAYIKQTSPNETSYSVYSENGRLLAVFPNYAAAFFTAKQFNFIPVSVH